VNQFDASLFGSYLYLLYCFLFLWFIKICTWMLLWIGICVVVILIVACLKYFDELDI
jgi:hypothetical protein